LKDTAMSAAAVADAAPAKGGKKLLLIIVAAVVVIALAGVAALLLLKKNAIEEEDDWDAPPAVQSTRKVDPAAIPTFLPLDTFTVNLADRTSERYAQVGVTLEVESKETADRLKAYMPAIRSNILLVLSQKTSTELMDRTGKEQLAMDIMREAVRPLGIDLAAQESAPADARRPRARVHNPIVAVHFSNFIIQ
jgi:flagellar protein FliL